MRIISWNSNGKFREKFPLLSKFNADIFVIQECEDPSRTSSADYKNFCKKGFWIGENKSKGLGIFSNCNIQLTTLHWPSYGLRYFLPVQINLQYTLLGVWAGKPYIEEFFIYNNINSHRYNKNTILIGDFNSNAIWDRKNDTRTHSAVVKQLSELGLISIYHQKTKEFPGNETQPTFFMHKDKQKSYHIDYCFAPPKLVHDFKLFSIENEGKLISDHRAIVIDI